jgi:hypothetical protein
MNGDSQRADAATPGEGFHLAEEPLLRPQSSVEPEEELPTASESDLLYSIARDPNSLFVYWDLSWPRLFQRAGLSPRAVHLRIYRADGEIESTREINPFRGHSYVDVAKAGANYSCELGCFKGKDWRALLRSSPASTPRGTPSDDLSATFATLPIHLSFQRLLNILEATEETRGQLAHAVAKAQEEASTAATGVTPKMKARETAADRAGELPRSARPVLRQLPAAVRERLWGELESELGQASEGCLGGSS